MSKTTLAGAGALLAAPILVIVATLVRPTVSEDAADQVAALTDHRGAVIAGLAIGVVAAVLLIAGTVWLAAAVASYGRNLALWGGILGVLGMLVVLFEDGVTAAAPSVVGVLDPAQATAVVDRIGSSAGVEAVEPVSIVAAIGLTLLAIGVVRAGCARIAAASLAIGAFVETAGFATGTRAVVVVGFVLLFLGSAAAVRTLTAAPRRRASAETVPAL
ncbi:MAG TPA: hypothetical protein VFI37_14940 [Gaiellaceae bacterium]|jgi:hypothetical protein|nr:hypothetical protein [Gaiellaceae bacterium]